MMCPMQRTVFSDMQKFQTECKAKNVLVETWSDGQVKGLLVSEIVLQDSLLVLKHSEKTVIFDLKIDWEIGLMEYFWGPATFIAVLTET